MLSDIFQWTGQSPLPNCPAPNVSCAKGEKPWLKAKALKSERTGFESRLCHTLPSSSWATCLNSEPQVLHLSNGVNSNAYLRKMTGGIHEITGYKEPEAYVLLIFHVSRAWVGLVLDLPPKAKSSVCWRRGSRVVRMRTLESERQSGLHLLPVARPWENCSSLEAPASSSVKWRWSHRVVVRTKGANHCKRLSTESGASWAVGKCEPML